MPNPDAEGLARLAAELRAAPTVAETADQVVSYAMSQLDADYAGVTLIRSGGRLETLAPSAPVVEEIDQLQYELGDGICVDSAWQEQTLRTSSLATDPRWPSWGPKAAALGVVSVLAAELTSVDDRCVGSLNLYWTTSQEFSSEDVAFAQLFRRHAAVALSSTMREANLRIALDSRKRIGQAQGILMERFDLTDAQAFQVLRRYSQDNNLKLRDIAERLATARQLP